MSKALKNKIVSATKDMMNKVEKVKSGRGHKYIAQVEPIKGKQVAGVTTISKGLSGFTTNIATNYGAKKMYEALGGYDEIEGVDHSEDKEYAKEQLEKIKTIDDLTEYLKLLGKAKKGHKRHTQKALADGSKGHDIIEKYVKRCIRENDGKPLKEGGYMGQEWIDNALSDLYSWFNEKVDTFYLSEARVCMLEPYEVEVLIQGNKVKQKRHTEYAGTLDLLALMKTGNLAVLDAKFANRIGREYKAQTSAYAKTFSPYDIEVPERIIMRLPKTEWQKKWDKKTYSYSKVDDSLEIKHFKKDNLEYDFTVFLNERENYRWKNAN